MELTKNTVSICPTCIKEIPATIVINNDGIVMHKTCPEHGATRVIVEKDPLFYMLIEMQGYKQSYPGSFVCVTSRCNIKCKYCYFPVDNSAADRTTADILKECRTINRPPFCLTGGDPTMREDLPELLAAIQQIGPASFITNGIKLADDHYLGTLLDMGLIHDGVTSLGISVHPEENNLCGEYTAKIQAIENFVRRGVKVHLLSTIDKLVQIDEYFDLLDQYRGTVASGVITLAANAGVERNVGTQLFVSEVYAYIENKAKREAKPFNFASRGNSTGYFTINFDGYPISIVRYPDRFNIDLDDLNCEPVAMCSDGKIVHGNYALLRETK